MAPKKEKRSEPSETEWQTTIEEAPLDEDNWKVKVILIESAGGEQERMYLNKFEIFAAEEKRFVIKNICKTETIFMINQLGAEKKVKDPKLRVFEECQSYLSDKRDIPPDLLALVIKYLILKMKDEYLFISQQRLEVKRGISRESATMLDKTEVKGTVGSARKDEQHAHPVKGKGKGDGESAGHLETLEGKKFNTQLRIRGEEWRDKVYVDDYPTDGPNLYVAVTGFVEPYLPGSLVRLGIPLTAVVQIRIDPSKVGVPSNLLKATKRGQSLTEILGEKSMKFWDDLQLLRIQDDSADDYKNTAFIVFTPPYWSKDDLSGNPDRIYDELCFLMYDIQDLSRQHLHYKENMSIIDVPEDYINHYFNELYEQKNDDLPLECVTIYSILDSILQTVCDPSLDDVGISGSSVSSATTAASNPKNDSKIEDDKLENTENLVKQIFTTLWNTGAGKKKYRLTYGREYEENREPVVLRYGDFAKYNTFHLGNINLDNIVATSLVGMPINNLWRNQPRPSDEHEAKINFHVNVLLSCFDRTDVETAELNRLVNILACRKLYINRSSLKKCHLPPTTIAEFKKKYLKRSVLAEPLPKRPSLVASGPLLSSSFPSMTRSENEYEYACSQPEIDPEARRYRLMFECPDISQLVTVTEIENNQPMRHNMIDDFDFFEDLSGIRAQQVLREAFNHFNCVDYKYCEVTDCFILMFFNSHNNEGIAREEWRSHLTTPVCLQDFFDFVMDEQYEWIQTEEKIYDDNMLMDAFSISKDVFDPHALKSCIETTDVEMDLLMEGSLKYEEYVKVVEAPTETSEFTSSFIMKVVPVTVPVSDTKINKKKPTSARNAITKFFKQSVIEKVNESVEIPAKPFLGYDLGDRRVEVFGKEAIFFSRDGTKVTTMYTLTIPINLEYIILNILPGNSYNEFWVHKALGDHVTPEVKDACESFRITSKDQVLIYIKKQKYTITLPSVFNSAEILSSRHKTNTSKLISDEPSKIVETKYFHSLYVSWPNGLITETVYDDNSPVISHIKQYHTRRMPHLDEEMRCVSLNGEVVIFKPSGCIDVLKPDGTFIQINKCYKRVVPLISQDFEVKSSSKSGEEIHKKTKKTRSKKSFKSTEPFEDTDLLPPEYEIVVNDCVITQPNGHRYKWIDNVRFGLEKLLLQSTNYCLGEVFSRRMDGTSMLMNKDGLYCVTFPDKTRIVTSYVVDDVEIYPEWTDREMENLEISELETIDVPKSNSWDTQKSNISTTTSTLSKKSEEEEVKERRTDGYVLIHILYTIEHPHFSTITINSVNETICVESPNGTKVIVDKSNKYEINLDDKTSATFDGEDLNISYEACSECRAFTNCNVSIMKNKESSHNLTSANVEQVWLNMTDSFDKKLVVNEEGDIILSDEPPSSDKLHVQRMNMEYENKNASDTDVKEPDINSESFLVSHEKSKDMHLAKNLRFFILRRDLNCAELLHRGLVEEYKRDCRSHPWCFIKQYDTFGGHRKLASILTPVHVTEPEKWLMESKQAKKPRYKARKDLKPKAGKGKGFYHWMRPYERYVAQPITPDNVLPERLPRAYILRILEREWDGENRRELMGARELIQAVLRYRCIMEADRETILNIPVIDLRVEDERRIDDIIKVLAHKIYQELKCRIAEDIQSRARLSITTQPLLKSVDISVEGEEERDDTKCSEEERESLVKESEPAEEMRPTLKRYWRRRAEEYKEEQFYKYLLREGSVPPYFRNVLGGAIWWEVNNATAEAVTLAERRKMKCVCTENMGNT